jgi:hypothetical protein
MNYLKKKEWYTQPLALNEARGFVEQYHYGRGGSTFKVACHGLYYAGDPFTLHGIAWWLPAALGAAKQAAGDNHRSVLSLSRFCLRPDRPENAGSFLISKSVKMLENRYTTLLTYADTALNHNGGLYRAANWSYYGLTNKQPYWENKDGVMVSRKQGPVTLTKTQMLEAGHTFKGNFEKHKFLYKRSAGNLLINPVGQQYELAFTEQGKIILP